MSILLSCHKDIDDGLTANNNQEPNPIAFAENFGNPISRNFLGTVIDKNHNPIENVTITIGGSIAQTDANGVFIISNTIVNQRFAYIKAEKTGYIHGSRAVVPSNGTNKISIMLLEEGITGTTNSGSVDTISLTNGASVALEGDYIKDDGTSYTGSVNVIMHFLNPVDEDMQNQMPGMLYAANLQNEERMLQTYGMLAIELRGSNGEDLNLAVGSTAEIKMPLDASLLANALSTIPLWYFDETNGYWIEDGQATLIGNTYVGTVSHFSFWNCDIPAEAVNLCVSVTDDTGNFLANIWVTITSSAYGTRGGYTNENGEVCGLVPSNETLEIETYNYDICGTIPFYTTPIGPFNSDSNITIAVAENPNIITETVIGNFNNCDGNPVTDGYVHLTYANQTFTNIVTDGDFEINLLRCSDENIFSIDASDYVNLQTTDSISYTFTTPLTNIGTITACNSVTEFIQYEIDNGLEDVLIINNINSYFLPYNQNENAPTLEIYGNGANCFFMKGILTEAPYVGEYNYYDSQGFITPDSYGFSLLECFDISQSANTDSSLLFNITSFGEVGEYIDINFSGDYLDTQGNQHTIAGIVHVLRDN